MIVWLCCVCESVSAARSQANALSSTPALSLNVTPMLESIPQCPTPLENVTPLSKPAFVFPPQPTANPPSPPKSVPSSASVSKSSSFSVPPEVGINKNVVSLIVLQAAKLANAIQVNRRASALSLTDSEDKLTTAIDLYLQHYEAFVDASSSLCYTAE
jgi:hypothetical protein